MGKRANREGLIRQRADGRWEARLAWTDADGCVRKKAFYGPTQREALAKMKIARDRLDAGQPVKDADVTLAAWAKRWRTTALPASDRKASTQATAAGMCRKHIESAPIGRIRLDRLRPSDVEAAQLRMRQDGYADSTRRQAYIVLRQVLDGAARDGLLARNPAAAVKPPRIQRREARHLSPKDVQSVLKAAEVSRYHTALLLIANTGLRRGEALALRWSHVDLKTGLLRVNGTISRADGKLVVTTPKSARSRREVPLSPAVVTVLKRHRTQQKRERIHAGDQWRETGLVFTTEMGGPVEPRNLLRTLQVAARAAKVEGIGVHTLRHSAATAWLESGVHIKAVADLLGHSSISITGDLYGHSSDETARAAVEGLSGLLDLG